MISKAGNYDAQAALVGCMQSFTVNAGWNQGFVRYCVHFPSEEIVIAVVVVIVVGDSICDS